ncbi:MAG: fibronectin type III domain-containing protein, partial [Thermoplasmata archaeon]
MWEVNKNTGRTKVNFQGVIEWALLSIAQAHEKSPRYSFTYISPKITSITWTPSYESATVSWFTTVPTTNNYVIIDGRNVSASGDGSTTHSASIYNLQPSTTYKFTVYSTYSGSPMVQSGSGTTRMRLMLHGLWDNYAPGTGKISFMVYWSTTSSSGISNHIGIIKYKGIDITVTPVFWGTTGGRTYWYIQKELNNPYREANIPVSVTIKGTYSGYEEKKENVPGIAYKNSDIDKLFDCEENYYNTNKYDPDTDRDGSWDSTEVWFMKSGANPTKTQRTTVIQLYGYGFSYDGRMEMEVNGIRMPPTDYYYFSKG